MEKAEAHFVECGKQVTVKVLYYFYLINPDESFVINPDESFVVVSTTGV